MYKRQEYPLAGIICIEKLTSSGSIVEIPDRLGRVDFSNLDPDSVKKYRKYAASLMKSYDKDGDDMLTKVEISEMRRPPSPNPDLNRDGLVSEDELLYSLASPGSRSPASRSRSSRKTKRTMVRDRVEGLLNDEKLRIEQNKQKAPAASKR